MMFEHPGVDQLNAPFVRRRSPSDKGCLLLKGAIDGLRLRCLVPCRGETVSHRSVRAPVPITVFRLCFVLSRFARFFVHSDDR